MRWYFAIDEAGGLGGPGAQAKLAVLTGRLAGLSPRLLYCGKETGFTAWMREQNVPVIPAEPSFLPTIRAAEAAGTHRSHSIGHWLRTAIPLIETESEFVLYTDCDVIFLRRVNWAALRPRVFAAAPEFSPDNWNYFNSGVMLLNVAAMRQTYDQFAARICARLLAGAASYDDQIALNEFYRGHWERLDPAFNWKPYWSFARHAAILHFHGPKPGDIASIAAGTWSRENPTGLTLARLLDGHLPAYRAWCTYLGDQLQTADFASALSFHELAAALARYHPGPVTQGELSFMNLRLFAD